jgi:superfamily II DNA or RNA helicase
MMLVHREPLIKQTYDKLCSFGIIDCGFIKSGRQENRDSLIQIASVQTLPNRNWWHNFPADLVILDECHYFLRFSSSANDV